MDGPDRVFLDANVLFSAAWRESSGLLRLWALPEVELMTSAYAAEEARVNLQEEAQRERLAELIGRLQVASGGLAELPAEVVLAEKDRPILAAAIAAGATHLLTGDVSHFGKLFGKAVKGVLILRPAEYLHTYQLPHPG
ncbi:MAG: PIN domain-containing protein [Polyangia bacterium]|jgi:predicted nucleic acid-binding protein|nr:PIN domain-containing protein [Polyangia bacterium]